MYSAPPPPRRSPISLGVAGPAHADSNGLVGAWSFDEGSGSVVHDASANGKRRLRRGHEVARRPARRRALVQRDERARHRAGLRLAAPHAGDDGRVLGAPDRARRSLAGARAQGAALQPRLRHYTNNGNGRPNGDVYTTRDAGVAGPSGLPLNPWSHLAMPWDGTTERLYVNGSQVSSAPLSGTAASSTSPLRFGGDKTWNEWSRGSIDDVRIYDGR